MRNDVTIDFVWRSRIKFETKQTLAKENRPWLDAIVRIITQSLQRFWTSPIYCYVSDVTRQYFYAFRYDSGRSQFVENIWFLLNYGRHLALTHGCPPGISDTAPQMHNFWMFSARAPIVRHKYNSSYPRLRRLPWSRWGISGRDLGSWAPWRKKHSRWSCPPGTRRCHPSNPPSRPSPLSWGRKKVRLKNYDVTCIDRLWRYRWRNDLKSPPSQK